MRRRAAALRAALLNPRIVVLTTGTLILSYLGLWATLSTHARVTSDFMATYVGAWLVRTGHGAHLYTYSAQIMGYHQHVWPSLAVPTYVPPFVGIPLAAVAAMPLSLFTPATAFIVWGAMQFAMLVTGCVIAYRAAPHARRLFSIEAAAILLVSLGTYATMDLLRSGQWDGLSALGVALAYSAWRKDRHATGAAVLVATALIAKPQLALGLVAFMAGWRERRVIIGALAAGVSLSLASLAIIGTGGVATWVQLLVANTHTYAASGEYGFIALPNGWFNGATVANLVGYIGILVLLGLCFVVGSRLRSGRLELGPALAGAAVLSLLAAPHSYTYDAVMLTPALVWYLGEHTPLSELRRHQRRLGLVLFFWYATTAVPLNGLLPASLIRLGNPCVWCLVALAVCLWPSYDCLQSATHKSAVHNNVQSHQQVTSNQPVV